MERKKTQDMSNSELKLYLKSLEDEFMSKRAETIKLCEEMEELQRIYADAKNELGIRKNIYL